MFWMLTSMALAGGPETADTRTEPLGTIEATTEPIRVELIGSVVPMGGGARAHIPQGRSGSVFVGGSVGAAVFSVDTMPIRVRAELGYRHYLGRRHDTFFIGPYATAALWTAVPELGGSNVAFGPMIGRAKSLRGTNATLVVAGGAMLHAYLGDYNGAANGDGFQVLPQLEVSLIL